MKRITTITVMCLGTLSLYAEQQRGKVIVHHNDNVKLVMQHIPKTTQAADQDPSHYLTRKKNTASIIFSGLAQVTAHVCNLIAGQDNREQQQAVLGIVGTSLNVAAQLTEKSDKNSPTTSPAQTKSAPSRVLSYELATLTTTLLDAIDSEQPTKAFLPPSLALLKNIPSNESRAGVIELMLLTPHQAGQLLCDLLITAQQYFNTNDWAV